MSTPPFTPSFLILTSGWVRGRADERGHPLLPTSIFLLLPFDWVRGKRWMSTATAVHAVDATTAACLPCLYAHRSAVACSSNGSPNACNHVLSVTTCDVTAPLEKGVHFSLPEKEPPLSTSGELSAILANLRLSSLLLLCGGAPTFNLWVCCPPFSQLETFNFHLLLCGGPPHFQSLGVQSAIQPT